MQLSASINRALKNYTTATLVGENKQLRKLELNAFFISYQLKSLLDLLSNVKSFNKPSFCLAKGCHRQNVGNSIAFATQITALHRSNVFDQTISP